MDSHAKKTRRFKTFLCFRPVAVDHYLVKPRRDGCVDDGSSGDPALFSHLSEDDSMAPPKIFTRISKDEVNICSDENLGKGGSRRRFTRVLKAIFFGASLAKKVRIKKARKNSNASLRSKSVSGKTNGTLDSAKVKPVKEQSTVFRPKSTCFGGPATSTTPFSSSSASSISSNSRSSLYRKVEEGCISNVGLCFLLVLLLVLIVWGKACSIVCTSSMLFLVPSRRGIHSPEAVVYPAEMDSAEYKKRVIMDGLLERSRNRVAYL
ncbi:uncharacterized protein LOC127812060 [Diospyros lotus]|uniref:uncharacterized protein LOC127812060 n=1 Tax=Diospyros lotus TaxID=55363 RepID=UPI00224E647F|nr:uncharacterized protein LOC127812060 [Diospyros lotus]